MVRHQKLKHDGEPRPDFHMKVRGYFKTALSCQVAEAVYIRRRGGAGAILNSRGEFSRCYIPQLQVVPEERRAAKDSSREITAKVLRELDNNWEQNKAKELGSQVILGPKSSPLKRMKEQSEDVTPAKRSKRRRKLKHGLLKTGVSSLPTWELVLELY